MIRKMGHLEVVINKATYGGKTQWVVYVVRGNQKFAAGGLAANHDTAEEAEWFANQVFSIITGRQCATQ